MATAYTWQSFLPTAAVLFSFVYAFSYGRWLNSQRVIVKRLWGPICETAAAFLCVYAGWVMQEPGHHLPVSLCLTFCFYLRPERLHGAAMQSLFNRLLVTLTEPLLCTLRALSPVLIYFAFCYTQVDRLADGAGWHNHTPAPVLNCTEWVFFWIRGEHFEMFSPWALMVDFILCFQIIHQLTASSVSSEPFLGHGGAWYKTTEAGQPGTHLIM